MTLPRTAAEVLSDHVLFEIRCVDRMLLSFRQPRLQYGSGIHGFFCHHRGNRFVSSTLMHPMTEHFAADIHHWLTSRDLDLVHFTKDQRKDDIAKQYLAGHDGGERILFVGRDGRRKRSASGGPGSAATRAPASPTHGWPRSLRWSTTGTSTASTVTSGPFYVKFCGYFPFNGQIYLNGHEYAKRQCERAGIGFTADDNAIVAAEEPRAIQRICDGLSQEAIYRFLGKWLARLPHPLTPEDEAADYRWQASIQQIELSTAQVMDRPRSGRIFFDQLIHDNIDIGRPDKVSIVFDRQIRRHHGKGATPGSFRTQIITEGVDPYLYPYYKKTQVKQYLKEGRALRTETTINQTRDFAIGKELTNLPTLQQVGFTANRRLLDVECISHDPADGAAALAAITDPVITDTGTRIPGLRFTDPRVRALLNVCCALALLPAGFTNRLLRHHLAPLLGLTPEAMTSGQISYDLRRLRAHGIITRIPHSRTYQVTPPGSRTHSSSPTWPSDS